MLNTAQIETLIPHAGNMCLLEKVLHFNENSIQTTTTSHQKLDNPLRFNHQLDIVCGVEYAAQSMALHAALIKSNAPAQGYLAAIRKLKLYATRLDTVAGDLLVESTRQANNEQILIYEFKLWDNTRLLSEGRLSIALI